VSAPTPEAVNLALEQLVPRAYGMGVRFRELRPGYVCADVPIDGNTNHFGVMYAGVIFTLAEVLGGAMHVATFDVTTHYPLVRSVSIDFIAPGTSALSAVAALEADAITEVRATAARNGKAGFELVADVTDARGELVARSRGAYQIRPHGT
jgi:acyl-coenzyme A thioesterase PaaI-like protein